MFLSLLLSLRRSGLFLGVALLLVALPTARAGFVPHVTATTTMGSGFSSDLQNTVNCQGLDAPPFLTTIHEGTNPINAWVGSTGVLSGEITFDLHGTYLVHQFLFWNLNDGDPMTGGASGIRDVVVLSSTDGVTFNPITGVLQFSMVNTPVALPETFTFAPVEATHLRFAVLNNWGNASRTGFGEVAFNGVAVPEPSSLVLCGAFGVAGMVGTGLRRRRATRG